MVAPSNTSHCETPGFSLRRLRASPGRRSGVERAFLGAPFDKFPKLGTHLWRTYIFGSQSHSNSNGYFLTLHTTACARSTCNQENAMFLHSIRPQQLATFAARVRAADEATPELLSEIVAGTVRRLSAPGEAVQLHQLIEAGALTEAAFAVIQLELPLWQIRRITYDEGEWTGPSPGSANSQSGWTRRSRLPMPALRSQLSASTSKRFGKLKRQESLAGCRYRGHEMINSSWFAAITSPSSLRIP